MENKTRYAVDFAMCFTYYTDDINDGEIPIPERTEDDEAYAKASALQICLLCYWEWEKKLRKAGLSPGNGSIKYNEARELTEEEKKLFNT